VSEWQPIETAPKDGTFVDLWVINSRGEGDRVANACWKTPWGPYDDKQVGWWGEHENSGDRRVFLEPTWRVTHWMPLPNPPEAKP